MATAHGNRPRGAVAPVYETHHDAEGEASLSETVIQAVATAENVDPTDRDLRLYESVDLEALDLLFERRSGHHWRFEFSTGDYLVVVEGDGRITVYENQ